jgi:Na+-transporting methylmalonyl-CoA/oxaloacetate decarboxylase gamma subunit
MAVDWGFAGQIGGFSFGLVFAVLIILAVATWVVGIVINKINTGKGETEGKAKGD